ncbi:MAG: hypothetical protein Q9178_006080 [Gyalolechia marmorata]
MAKNRSNPAAGGKAIGYASTAGIFKQHKSHVPSKDRRQQRPKALRSVPISKPHKHKHKTQHPLSEAFSGTQSPSKSLQNPGILNPIFPDTIEESRQSIEERTTSRLDTIRDALISQTHSLMHNARERMQNAENSAKALLRSLDDELLELTRKDGTVVTMTLGKRIDAYRKLVLREKENLGRLFARWEEVSSEINGLAVTFFGAEGVEKILKGGSNMAELPDFVDAEQRALMGEVEAEMERAKVAAAAIGAKAVEAMKAAEKELTAKHKNNLLQLCNTMFGEEDDV